MSPDRRHSILNSVPYDKYLPDILGFFLYFLFFDPMLQWQEHHPGLSCILLMGLNIAAVGFGVFSFFAGYADMKSLIAFRNSLSTWESAALGISAFISCFAFFWWLVPFSAVKTMGVKDAGMLPGALLYFIVFMAAVAGSINYTKGIEIRKKKIFQLANSVIMTIFFFFAYVFLVMTLQRRPPSYWGATELGIISLVVFYLPLRFFLLIRPPSARIEYLFFLLMFGYLLYELFAKTG